MDTVGIALPSGASLSTPRGCVYVTPSLHPGKPLGDKVEWDLGGLI